MSGSRTTTARSSPKAGSWCRSATADSSSARRSSTPRATIRHKPFKLVEHVERLFRSMRYLRIDAGLGRDEMVSISEEVLERNLHLIAPDEDYWLFQRVTPGSADPFLGEAAAEPHRDRRMHPAAPEGPRAALPRPASGCSPGHPAYPAGCGEPAGQDPELHQPPTRRPGGSRTGPARLGGSSSTTTATSRKGSAATSSSCATAGCSPRASASCCPASAARR